jgi:hypothetical protein
LRKTHFNLATLTKLNKINHLYAAGFSLTLTNPDTIFGRVCQGCQNETRYWRGFCQGCNNLDMLKAMTGKDCGKVAGLSYNY